MAIDKLESIKELHDKTRAVRKRILDEEKEKKLIERLDEGSSEKKIFKTDQNDYSVFFNPKSTKRRKERDLFMESLFDMKAKNTDDPTTKKIFQMMKKVSRKKLAVSSDMASSLALSASELLLSAALVSSSESFRNAAINKARLIFTFSSTGQANEDDDSPALISLIENTGDDVVTPENQTAFTITELLDVRSQVIEILEDISMCPTKTQKNDLYKKLIGLLEHQTTTNDYLTKQYVRQVIGTIQEKLA